MHQLIYRGCIAIVALAVLTVASTQAAETQVPPAGAGAATETKPAPAAGNKAVSAPFAVPPQDEQRLERLRGGSEPVWNDMKLSGTVGANSAQNVISGANTISDGAFANAVGLPTVIQNSGANVLIQNATIVNVQIR